MTDTMGSTPQPQRPQSGSKQAQPPRFRLPEPQQQAPQQPQPTANFTPTRPAGSTPPAPRSADDRANPGSLNAMTPPPEGRYGEKRGLSTPRKIGLAATGLVILGGVAGYIGWQQSHPTIQGTVTSFNASTTSVLVTFEVDKPADKSATCTLNAQDVHGTVVGSASVPVLAGRAKNVQSYTLQTTATANTVIVQSCSLTS
jgi:hypothetical protein